MSCQKFVIRQGVKYCANIATHQCPAVCFGVTPTIESTSDETRDDLEPQKLENDSYDVYGHGNALWRLDDPNAGPREGEPPRRSEALARGLGEEAQALRESSLVDPDRARAVDRARGLGDALEGPGAGPLPNPPTLESRVDLGPATPEDRRGEDREDRRDDEGGDERLQGTTHERGEHPPKRRGHHRHPG